MLLLITGALNLHINLGNSTVYANHHHVEPQRKIYSRYYISLKWQIVVKGCVLLQNLLLLLKKKKSFFLQSKRKRGVFNIKIVWKCPINEFFINDYIVSKGKWIVLLSVTLFAFFFFCKELLRTIQRWLTFWFLVFSPFSLRMMVSNLKRFICNISDPTIF